MLHDLLKLNNYQLDRFDWGMKISSKNGSELLYILSVVFGAFLGYFGFKSGSYELGLFAIILVAVPFTSHTLANPKAVIFNHRTNRIIIQKAFGNQVIEMLDSPELVVNYYRRSSFVSPFEEGYEDHYYDFELKLPEKEKKIQIFRLKSRQPIDENVEKVVQEISDSMPFWSPED
jgi:hypothetical protein